MGEKREYQANVVDCQVDIDVAKRAGGTYKGALITYRSNGQIQEKGIAETVYNKIRPFLKPKLLAMKSGDIKYLVMEKNGEYWELMDITDAPGTQSASSNPSSTPAPTTGSTQRSSKYDNDSPNLPINVTSQRSYARIQAITCAIDYLAKMNPNCEANTSDTISLARIFEGYITGDADKAEADQGIGAD